MSHSIKLAFVGNPNCGKTTLFNAFTGAKHKVGNWAGVTVEKREGEIQHDGTNMILVDLPGIYSLSPYSIEEILTREYILNEQPDIIVNVVDASNLERNLYLTLQLMEIGRPMIVVLTMMDVVESRQMNLDLLRLKEALGVPVIPVIASKKNGLKNVLHKAIKMTKNSEVYAPVLPIYVEMEEQIARIESMLIRQDMLRSKVTNRWIAMKLLEKDQSVINKMQNPEILKMLESTPKMNYEEAFAKQKYDYINSFIRQVLNNDETHNEIFSDKIDKIVTNHWLGIPIFLVMMALVFVFTFTVGNFVADLFDHFFSFFSEGVRDVLNILQVADWLISLIVDGVIGGVGGILIFLPNIAALFVAMSILEDSGYMARVALIMDQFMKRIGLSGKAFIPMILGFGCSVPAIMTARTLEDEKDRLITILITPFMSCSARFPIYVLFSRAFFPGNEILVAFSLYVLGIIVAIVMALVFKRTIGKNKESFLIMELPNYKMPTLKTTGIFVWEKVRGYIERAGTIIFFASIVLWFMLAFNTSGPTDMNHSIGAAVGQFIAPIFSPMGFGNWQAALSLLSGIMGKEIVVSSMAVIYGVGDGSLVETLKTVGFTQASAYAFMVFSLLYTACIATLGVIRKETNSYRWMIFSFVYQLVVAWCVSGVIYQIAILF